MRVVKELSHPVCKITIFSWNQKYLLKFELGAYEQTFKISQLDSPELNDVESLLTGNFMSRVATRFEDMHQALAEASK